ncbi:fumarylacetoacetate hydrolase family protein [Candidatus Sumerlaeota bacterium]|nr:fumarylacetoacetate hydrolase family protein [Candidatus Sumerlaeota bacterium]
MRLFNFEQDGKRRLGVKIGDRLVDITDVSDGRVCRILDFLRLEPSACRDLEALVNDRARSLPELDEETTRFLSVVEAENKFMCIGQNYADHCREQNVEPPARPIMFGKLSNALTGHRTVIPMPVTSTAIDFEVELAVVIGRTCHRVGREEAMAYVAGYTVVNDVTARDHQKSDGQWVRGKGLDGFGPNGPFLVTADEVADPHNLGIWLDLNGRRTQQSSTSNLVFDIAYLIHYYSQDITLQPGDLISTGTPPGVGAFRKPPLWVQAGDMMEATVEQVGTLINWLGRK